MTATVPLAPPASLSAATLAIARFRSHGTTDWPGRPAATVCLQGCPWQCTSCHEPSLQSNAVAGSIPWDAVMAGLRRRRTILNSVVFTGGEPTRQPGLEDAMHQVRALGYNVGLMTAGAYPGKLAELLPLIDWVGIDIKATASSYDMVTGQGVSGARAWRSLALLKESGVDYEVTVTVDPTTHARQDVLNVVRDIIRTGAHAPVLQQARPAPGSEYAKRLRGRGIYDVIRIDDLPDLERR